MKRVLFVDDDPHVLDGLRRSLRRQRDRWEMGFVTGAREAIACLEQAPYDVVVSDMRMPGVDGVSLLRHVLEHHPGTVRIALSGHADAAMSVQAARVAQQFLTKPCEADVVRATVERALALHELLNTEALVRLISGIDTLPSLPRTYQELVETLNAPDASVHRVAGIVSRDPAMTAKTLQLVNSAFFGLPRKVNNPVIAVSLLGLDLIASLALASGVFVQCPRLAGLDGDALWSHSVRTATLAKRIAEDLELGEACTQRAFTAGLLHDVGKLVLASGLPEDFARARALARAGGLPAHRAEREVFGCAHPEVGAYLLGLWGLDDRIVEAVAYHHGPAVSGIGEVGALTAVHAADGLLQPGAQGAVLDADYLGALGLEDALGRWCRWLGGSDWG